MTKVNTISIKSVLTVVLISMSLSYNSNLLALSYSELKEKVIQTADELIIHDCSTIAKLATGRAIIKRPFPWGKPPLLKIIDNNESDRWFRYAYNVCIDHRKHHNPVIDVWPD